MKKTIVNHFAYLIVLLASTTTAFAQARPQRLTEQPSPQSSGMDSYHNVKYSYSIEYPKRLLVPQGESDAQDGQRFEAKDGTFKMAVWGQFNVLEEKLESKCQEEQKEPALVVSYRFAKGSVCAFSGVKDSTIIYQKIVFLDDTFKTLRLEYPAKQKQLLDPVVNRIIASFQTVRNPPAAVSELSVVATAGSSSDGGFKAYQAAKNLEASVVALNVAKQRAEQGIKAVSVDIGKAVKYPGDKEIVAATKATSQIMNEVSVKAQSSDPRDEGQISNATSRLMSEQNRLRVLVRQSEVLSTVTGKRVYEGCTAWAKRTGTMVSDAPVQIFKDAETNKAADFAANAGRHLCSCMAVEIGGDSQITDEAKLEVARQFETRNRMDNQALAGIVAGAYTKCYLKAVDDLSGGALSRSR